MSSNPFSVDRKSGLVLPFTRCGKCGGERLWRDLNQNLRCWDCIPPQAVQAAIIKEKRKKAADEQRAVNDFIEEDEDIQDYNFRHFGQRTS